MQISDAEWVVMNLIWNSSPIEAAEVVEQLAAANGWSAATVKSMLHRLVRKGALSTEQVGKKYLYRPAVRRDACVRTASRSFLQRVFNGDATPALIHFVKNAKLSPEDVEEIRTLLEQKAPNQGERR
ncbi:MAG: BlaI/MecI/CopY family transcriptional regulator [Pirellulaceae bacterium]|jgi:BlaI family transcriptional regulator, penicillinase repressor|nr:BlaI/MecI/CopY family transcriptional regulator [Pirellulaceae bacterium]